MIKKILLVVTVILALSGCVQAQWFSIPQRQQPIDTNAIRGYRVYAVLITQLDEFAPEVTVIQNTFGLEPVWSYVNTGIFGCTFSGGFMGDTCVFVQDNYILYDNMNYGGNYWIYIEKSSSGFSLYTYAIDEGGGSMNGLLTNTFLEFRIY